MEIILVQGAYELEDAYHVRKVVFVNEQKVPPSIEIDDQEKFALHFVGYENGRPIAASRMRFIDDYGKLERICVLQSYRNKSYGKQMIEKMEELAKSRGYKKTKLNSQTHAEGFYQSLGYQTISSEPFIDAGISHVTMIKELKG